MKRLKYAVILLLGLSMATIMTSCSKESSYKDRIVGEWQMISDTYYAYDSSGTLIIEDADYDGIPNESAKWKFDFLSEGMVKLSSYWLKSNTEILFVPYLIEGSDLYIDINDPIVYTIQELTNSKMVWKEELSSYGNPKRLVIYEFKRVS